MKLEFSRQIFEENLKIKFQQNPSSGSRVVPMRTETDVTKVMVAFRSFANAPKNGPVCFAASSSLPRVESR